MRTIDKVREWVRPGAVVASIAFILLGGYLAFALELIRRGLGHSLIDIIGAWLSAIPDAAYGLISGIILGYFGSRGAENWAKTKYSPTAPATVPGAKRPLPEPTFGQETSGERPDV